jgi:hypothetical protein
MADVEGRYAGVNDKQLFRRMRNARGEELEALRREASRRGLQEEVPRVVPLGTAEEALRNIITAWEALPGEQSHTDIAVERWLRRSMKPAIDRARRVLGIPTEQPE